MFEKFKKQLLKRFLEKKKYIKNNSNLIEINESCWNKVFTIDNIFFKVSEEANNLQIEFIILNLLTDNKFPKPIFYDNFIEKWTIYYVIWISKIEGKTIEHYWGDMDLNDKEKLILDVISCTKRINSTKQLKWIPNILDKRGEIIENWKYKANPDIWTNKLNSYFEDIIILMKKIKDEKNYIIHWDLWYKNILVENNSLSWIIDFETSFLAPIRFEYYGLLLTNFYVFTTDCWDSWEFEKEFCEIFTNTIKKEYNALLIDTNKEEFILFCFIAYLKKLWQYGESWYDKNETLSFMEKVNQFGNSIFK